MTENTKQAFTKMRRKDRAVNDTTKVEAWLRQGQIGSLATAVDGFPFINTNTYWYDGEKVFVHNASKGRVVSNITANPNVCFTIAERGRYLPADRAMEFSMEYRSVVIFGRAELVEDEKQKRYVLEGLMQKYFPHLEPDVHYQRIQDQEMLATSIIAITIEAITGKQKKMPDDFPTQGPLRPFYHLDEVLS